MYTGWWIISDRWALIRAVWWWTQVPDSKTFLSFSVKELRCFLFRYHSLFSFSSSIFVVFPGKRKEIFHYFAFFFFSSDFFLRHSVSLLFSRAWFLILISFPETHNPSIDYLSSFAPNNAPSLIYVHVAHHHQSLPCMTCIHNMSTCYRYKLGRVMIKI